jgi:hypothetical protein
MNYQLMFQTIAQICGIALVGLGISYVAHDINRNMPKNLPRYILVLFIITLITGALAAGLS